MDILNLLPVTLASIGAFLTVILILVGLLIYAKEKLIPSGEIKLIINDDEENPMIVQPGQTLFSALSQKNIFLPSACGGGGTCAMCRCQDTEGGGDVLPTEMNHLTRKEAQEHWRLGCQVKVKQDMKIHVPEEIFGIKKWECEVIGNDNVATFIKEFVVKLPEGENLDFESGGYIQIDVPPIEIDFKDMKVHEKFHGDWDKFGLWDLKMKNDELAYRAYSMANHPAEGNIVMLNIRIATPPWDRAKNQWMDVNPGLCSSYVFSLKKGDKVTLSGPYGEFAINETEREMVYIGGGAGMAPLRSHIFELFKNRKSDRKVSYWYGGRSRRELFYTEHFKEIEEKFPNFKYHIALSSALPEDNWTEKKDINDDENEGYVGFIHQVLLDNYLSTHPAPEDIEYYICGPPMMNSAVFKMLDDLGVEPENIAFDDFGG